jgi:hypothetical protein
MSPCFCLVDCATPCVGLTNRHLLSRLLMCQAGLPVDVSHHTPIVGCTLPEAQAWVRRSLPTCELISMADLVCQSTSLFCRGRRAGHTSVAQCKPHPPLWEAVARMISTSTDDTTWMHGMCTHVLVVHTGSLSRIWTAGFRELRMLAWGASTPRVWRAAALHQPAVHQGMPSQAG